MNGLEMDLTGLLFLITVGTQKKTIKKRGGMQQLHADADLLDGRRRARRRRMFGSFVAGHLLCLFVDTQRWWLHGRSAKNVVKRRRYAQSHRRQTVRHGHHSGRHRQSRTQRLWVYYFFDLFTVQFYIKNRKKNKKISTNLFLNNQNFDNLNEKNKNVDQKLTFFYQKNEFSQ